MPKTPSSPVTVMRDFAKTVLLTPGFGGGSGAGAGAAGAGAAATGAADGCAGAAFGGASLKTGTSGGAGGAVSLVEGFDFSQAASRQTEAMAARMELFTGTTIR